MSEAETNESGEIELFHKNRGIRLPDPLRQSLGLTTGELFKREFQVVLTRDARVYREGNGGAPALAVMWLPDEDAEVIGRAEAVGLTASGGTVRVLKCSKVGLGGAWQNEITLEIAYPDGGPAVGSAVGVTFTDTRSREALGVPVSAVIHGVEESFVYTVNGEHFSRAGIRLGTRVGDWVEVAEGLYEGDQVVVTGADALWLIELCALRGGTPCCAVETKRSKDAMHD